MTSDWNPFPAEQDFAQVEETLLGQRRGRKAVVLRAHEQDIYFLRFKMRSRSCFPPSHRSSADFVTLRLLQLQQEIKQALVTLRVAQTRRFANIKTLGQRCWAGSAFGFHSTFRVTAGKPRALPRRHLGHNAFCLAKLRRRVRPRSCRQKQGRK
jgi:hypothetical protein